MEQFDKITVALETVLRRSNVGRLSGLRSIRCDEENCKAYIKFNDGTKNFAINWFSTTALGMIRKIVYALGPHEVKETDKVSLSMTLSDFYCVLEMTGLGRHLRSFKCDGDTAYILVDNTLMQVKLSTRYVTISMLEVLDLVEEFY